jgi:hypothetical protein
VSGVTAPEGKCASTDPRRDRAGLAASFIPGIPSRSEKLVAERERRRGRDISVELSAGSEGGVTGAEVELRGSPESAFRNANAETTASGLAMRLSIDIFLLCKPNGVLDPLADIGV